MVANNIVLSILTIVFSVIFLVYASFLPAGRPGAGTWGPAAWPALMLSLMLITGILLLIKTLIQRKRGADSEQSKEILDGSEEENETETEILEPEVVYPHRHWVIFGMLILYTFLMGYAGFVLTTFLFILFATKVMGIKKWVSALLTTVLGTPAIIFLFANLLAVPLPRGIGIFRELSFLIY